MLAHLVPALIVQLLVTLLTRHYGAGAAGGCVWAVSREIAQAEYRWIEQFGGGLRANMPWWGGLDHRVWMKLDPWLDWIVPSLVAIAIALIARRVTDGRQAGGD
jgi:hypothetical protein